jgi:hypothetical protein
MQKWVGKDFPMFKIDLGVSVFNISVISWLSQFSCLTFWDTGPQGLCFSNFTLLIGGPPKNA